jgi:hypothetical protein
MLPFGLKLARMTAGVISDPESGTALCTAIASAPIEIKPASAIVRTLRPRLTISSSLLAWPAQLGNHRLAAVPAEWSSTAARTVNWPSWISPHLGP